MTGNTDCVALGRAMLTFAEQNVETLRRQLAQAEKQAAYLAELLRGQGPAEALAGEKPDLSKPEVFDLTRYDPRWKTFRRNGDQSGGNLTDFGRAAVQEAYRRNFSQVQVRELFEISSAAASNHYARFVASAARAA
jgi:hypothetical protein